MSRLYNKSFELLEPYEGKLSRTVLRGESDRKVADLPDQIKAVSQSEQSYPEIFRILNVTRIEFDSLESSPSYELEKNKLKKHKYY
jgi:hypothetical protein